MGDNKKIYLLNTALTTLSGMLMYFHLLSITIAIMAARAAENSNQLKDIAVYSRGSLIVGGISLVILGIIQMVMHWINYKLLTKDKTRGLNILAIIQLIITVTMIAAIILTLFQI